jgi:PPM family protein phosphatase
MQFRTGVEFAHLSDVGCQRQENEDSFGIWEPATPAEIESKGILAVVADGMGGYQGGREASQIAVKTVCEIYEQASVDLQAALLAGLQTAHVRIQEYAGEHPGFFGMGTTCTAISLVGSHLYFAHVGDSRLYLVRGSSIARLTRDDSYVNRLVETGLINQEEAETHPQRHILTAALGVGADLVPDSPPGPILLLNGDVLVLCTDGLWGQVNDHELHDSVSTMPPVDACHKLVKLARDRGGPDNITIEVLRFSNGDSGGEANPLPAVS